MLAELLSNVRDGFKCSHFQNEEEVDEKTSLRWKCVDYVCQWGRLKIIICGLRPNKCICL